MIPITMAIIKTPKGSATYKTRYLIGFWMPEYFVPDLLLFDKHSPQQPSFGKKVSLQAFGLGKQ